MRRSKRSAAECLCLRRGPAEDTEKYSEALHKFKELRTASTVAVMAGPGNDDFLKEITPTVLRLGETKPTDLAEFLRWEDERRTGMLRRPQWRYDALL